MIWGIWIACLISLESLLKKPLKNLCERHMINVDGTMLVLARRLLMWVSLALASIIFRSASVNQLGEAYSVLFTKFDNYFSGAVTCLGLTPIRLLLITLITAGMCMLWKYRCIGTTVHVEVREKCQSQFFQRISLKKIGYWAVASVYKVTCLS